MNEIKNLETDNDFCLNLFSKYRNCLYGIASCLIVLHHLTIRDSSNILSKAYMFIRVIGAFGVDMFVFLAGMGLYYSFKKHQNIWLFYKRRLLRLVPIDIIIELPYCLFFYLILKGDWKQFLISFFCIDFWIEGTGNWFFPAILFLYLIYPLIYYMLGFRKGPCLVICVFSFFLLLLFFIAPNWFMNTNRLWARIPVYILGCISAPYIYEGRQIKSKKNIYLLATFVFIASLAIEAKFALTSVEMAYSIWARLVYAPLSISFMILCIGLFERIHLQFVQRIMVFVGSITFPIYLLNQKMINLMDYLLVRDGSSIMWSILSNFIAVMLTILIAWAVTLIADRLTKKWLNAQKAI